MNVEDYGPLLTAEAFLEIDFGERIKAELDDGDIRVVERGPRRRVWIAGNLLAAVHPHVRGSRRRVYGSLLALKTGTRSVRYPDVAVYDGDRALARHADRDLMIDPLLAAHICRTDRVHGRLVDEYLAIDSLQGLLMVDHERELVRSFARRASGDWEETLVGAGQSVGIASLSLTIPHAHIFASDR